MNWPVLKHEEEPKWRTCLPEDFSARHLAILRSRVFRFVDVRETRKKKFKRKKADLESYILLPSQKATLFFSSTKTNSMMFSEFEGRETMEEYTLYALFVRFQVSLEERVYPGPETRYLAVWRGEPRLVCEITKDAFETLTNTRRRKEYERSRPKG
jgi:hypothetical protein